MLTYGEYPYAECATAEDVALQVVTLGACLPRPEACSAQLGTLMENCECGSERDGCECGSEGMGGSVGVRGWVGVM